MTNAQSSLLARPDTMLGICEGMGDHLGISPTIFRLAFAISLLFNPTAVIATYLGFGLVVAIVRWRSPRRIEGAAVPRPAPERSAGNDGNDGEATHYARAA